MVLVYLTIGEHTTRGAADLRLGHFDQLYGAYLQRSPFQYSCSVRSRLLS